MCELMAVLLLYSLTIGRIYVSITPLNMEVYQ